MAIPLGYVTSDGAALAGVLEDAAVRDADVGSGAAGVERDALWADPHVRQLQALGLAGVDGLGYGRRGQEQQQQGEQDREQRQLRRRPSCHGRCHVDELLLSDDESSPLLVVFGVDGNGVPSGSRFIWGLLVRIIAQKR